MPSDLPSEDSQTSSSYPGQVWSLDDQCKMRYGANASFCRVNMRRFQSRVSVFIFNSNLSTFLALVSRAHRKCVSCSIVEQRLTVLIVLAPCQRPKAACAARTWSAPTAIACRSRPLARPRPRVRSATSSWAHRWQLYHWMARMWHARWRFGLPSVKRWRPPTSVRQSSRPSAAKLVRVSCTMPALNVCMCESADSIINILLRV